MIAEILVVDDGSTDPLTQTMLLRVAEIPRVSVLRNRFAKGSGGARNTAMAEARGEWIAFLDADDWWPVESLAARIAVLEEHPSINWIGGDFEDVSGGEEPTGMGRFERRLGDYPFLSPAYGNDRKSIVFDTPLPYFLTRTPTVTITTLIRTRTLREHGGFDERQLRAQDFHLWLRLAASESFAFVPKVLAYYRHHDSNSTKSYSHTLEWRVRAIADLIQRGLAGSSDIELRAQLAESRLNLSYEYRKERRFFLAAWKAMPALLHSRHSFAAFRSIAAACLRR